MTQATPAEALETHLLLDPEIQHKIFEILKDGFTNGHIPTNSYQQDWVPVNDLAHALVYSAAFRQHLKDLLGRVTIRMESSMYRKGEYNISLDLSEM